MKVIIRTAGEKDFHTILLLIKEFSEFQKTPEKVVITLDQMLREKDYFQCIVAEAEDHEILGFATFFFAYYSWSGKALYLDDLYVRSIFRNQGIGKQLLQQVIQRAKDEACVKLRWQVSGWNSNAIEFYKNIGAAIDKTEINCDLYLSNGEE